MSERRTILATSGGFDVNDHGELVPGGLVEIALRLSGAERPRFCVLATADGDDKTTVDEHYAALEGWSVDVSHLALFPKRNVEDVRSHLLSQDVIWVDGGSVAGLMAMWRLHGVDEVMREAWEAGVVLAGRSAGSICWYRGGTTDSYGPSLRAVRPFTDGLGLLPYGNDVHRDGEPERRALFDTLVADGIFPLAHASDDGVGLHYSGTKLVGVYTTQPGASGYLVESEGDGVRESRLDARSAREVLAGSTLTRQPRPRSVQPSEVTPRTPLTPSIIAQVVAHMRNALNTVKAASDTVSADLDAFTQHDLAVHEALKEVAVTVRQLREALTAVNRHAEVFEDARSKMTAAQAELDEADKEVSVTFAPSLPEARRKFRQAEHGVRAGTARVVETLDTVTAAVDAVQDAYAEHAGIVVPKAKTGLRYTAAITKRLEAAIRRLEE